MNILNLIFTDQWSWGLSVQEVKKKLKEYNWCDKLYYRGPSDHNFDYDIIFSQQITLMKIVDNKESTVCRLGGNRTFDENKSGIFDEQIKQVFAVIATNQQLYEIAKKLNPNTYLIPNSLDLSEWCPSEKKLPEFVVGFSGNISSDAYREYKGYEYVEKACDVLGVQLKCALYGEEQLPYNQMRENFYSKISVLVHPTKGEGSSNVIMESLACGIPVITTKEAGYHGEMLQNGENVLFCNRSVESVKEQITRLMKDRNLYRKISENSRKFAEENHNIDDMILKYKDIFEACDYNQLCKKRDTNRVESKQVVSGMVTKKSCGYRPLHGR